VREDEAVALGLARYCVPPADSGLGARAGEFLAGKSRVKGDRPEFEPEPDETLEGPAKGLLPLALVLELGSERPSGDEPASGERAVGRDEGIESCEGRGTAREPVARPGGIQI
jgi:hypothetical protein